MLRPMPANAAASSESLFACVFLRERRIFVPRLTPVFSSPNSESQGEWASHGLGSDNGGYKFSLQCGDAQRVYCGPQFESSQIFLPPGAVAMPGQTPEPAG